MPRPPVLPERSRPQRVVPEAVDGELEGEARQARARARSPKPKVSTASSPPPVPKKVPPADKKGIPYKAAPRVAPKVSRGSHGHFKPAFTDALRAFVLEHLPVCIAILSFCSRASAEWYEVHFLREAVDCLHALLPSSTRVRFGQTFSRTGPEGKAQQLSQIDPPASVVIDDNKWICKECRKTGALVVQASKGGDVDQLLFELDEASRLIKEVGRDNLPRARQLEARELLYEA